MRREIEYPEASTYVEHWGEESWPLIREIVTNAMDADIDYTMRVEDGTLIVENGGNKLGPWHWVKGVTEKPDEHARGQFGEGLKLAALIITLRTDMEMIVRSGRLEYTLEAMRMLWQDTFKVKWHLNGHHIDGCQVIVRGWNDRELYPERFLKPDDDRILYTDEESGRSILYEDADVQNIFLKEVWAQEATRFAFGYNLKTSKIGRERNLIHGVDVEKEVATIWKSVTDKQLIKGFWRAIKDKKGERDISLAHYQLEDSNAWVQTFKEVFGQHAVVKTSEATARAAEYRGATVVDLGYWANRLATGLVGTDIAYVQAMSNQQAVPIPDKELNDQQLKTIRLARRLARRYTDSPVRVEAYMFEEEKVLGRLNKSTVMISVSILDNPKETIATLIHELAHFNYRTTDNTPQHADAIGRVGAALVVSYAVRG